ncbi:MAG: hypothetical protein ACKPJ4_15705, partial [Dolichospermum sp.]
VKNSILETDIDTIVARATIFKEALRKNFKDCLKYINVGNATAQTNLFFTLPGNINISEVHFLETQEKETFNMEYDIPPGMKILPAIFLGREDKKCQDFYNNNLQHRKLLIFPHRLETPKLESHQEIIYKITYSLKMVSIQKLSLLMLLSLIKMSFVNIYKTVPPNQIKSFSAKQSQIFNLYLWNISHLTTYHLSSLILIPILRKV